VVISTVRRPYKIYSSSWPSSSGLRGRRRTYHTLLKLADHALCKMVKYVLLRPLRPELDAKTKTCLPANTRFCHLDEQAINFGLSPQAADENIWSINPFNFHCVNLFLEELLTWESTYRVSHHLWVSKDRLVLRNHGT
jgi:hypothetical protein